MKISGTEKIMLALTAAFLLLTVGYFLGVRGNEKPYVVDAQILWTGEVGADMEHDLQTRPVNINTATAQQLQSLPGIGQVRAQDIVADREGNGPFRIPEDLLRVPGIGTGTLNEILEYITVE